MDKFPPASHGDGETRMLVHSKHLRSKSWNSTNLWIPPSLLVMIASLLQIPPYKIEFSQCCGGKSSQVLPENCPNKLQVVVKYHDRTLLTQPGSPYFPLEPTGCRGLLEEPRALGSWFPCLVDVVWVDAMSELLCHQVNYFAKLGDDQIDSNKHCIWCNTLSCLSCLSHADKPKIMNNLAKIRYRFYPQHLILQPNDTWECTCNILIDNFFHQPETAPKNWKWTHNSCSRVLFRCLLLQNHLSNLSCLTKPTWPPFSASFYNGRTLPTTIPKVIRSRYRHSKDRLPPGSSFRRLGHRLGFDAC